MSTFSNAFVILNDRGDICAIETQMRTQDLDVSEDGVLQVALEKCESGRYWSVLQRLERERRTCLLIQLDCRNEDGVRAADYRHFASRILLDESFSEGFRTSAAELQRKNLEFGGIPSPIIDAYLLAQVESLNDTVVC